MRVPSLRLSVCLVIVGGFSAACAPAASVARSARRGNAASLGAGTITRGVAALPPSAVCAAIPGVLLQPAMVEPGLVVTSLGGEPAPVLLGQPVPGATVPASGFEWTEDEIAAVRGLPTDFGPRDASFLVAEFPTRIDQFIETANTFASVTEAVRWFASWPGISALSPWVLEPGVMRDAIPAVASLAQADEIAVTTWSRTGVDMPSDTQYLIRMGNTVITLELIGGEQVSDAPTETDARAALELVLEKCAGLLSR